MAHDTFINDIVIFFSQLGDFYLELHWDFQSWGKNYITYLYVLIGAKKGNLYYPPKNYTPTLLKEKC